MSTKSQISHTFYYSGPQRKPLFKLNERSGDKTSPIHRNTSAKPFRCIAVAIPTVQLKNFIADKVTMSQKLHDLRSRLIGEQYSTIAKTSTNQFTNIYVLHRKKLGKQSNEQGIVQFLALTIDTRTVKIHGSNDR